MARMLVAAVDGPIRDHGTLKFDRDVILGNGDMIFFQDAKGITSGINVEVDGDGLHSLVSFQPWMTLRIGLIPRGDGVYEFRPAPHHLEMCPDLRAAT